MDANPLWAVAVKLEQSGHYRAAQKKARAALSKADNPSERFRILTVLGSIHLSLNRPAQAETFIIDTLSTPDLPLKQRRDALVLRGRAEGKLDKLNAAAASYGEARRCIPEETVSGDILREEFDLYYGTNEDSNKNLVDIVRKWTPLERLAWMTWNYSEDNSQHETFRWACGTSNATDFMVEAYSVVIERLDNFNAGAPIRYELALSHRNVRNDLEATRATFSAILDSSATHDY